MYLAARMASALNQFMSSTHSFNIPVMGLAFTADTPLKVSHFGIDSVIPIGDDHLLEKLRKIHCAKFELPYEEISEKTEDSRAQRITRYLNLIQQLSEQKFEEFKESLEKKGTGLREFFSMLSDQSSLKQEFKLFMDKHPGLKEVGNWIRANLSPGSIDVNIMTKLDKENYRKDEKLPVEFNDAHAALRGYANSTLSSSIVFSAGLNPRLYSYLEQFEDFYPDASGEIKKKIILKVSDYRSALIQGQYLAKKGLWVSEYRIESGLNCGGHAFATDGFLMGPILSEFREKRNDLVQSTRLLFEQALSNKNRIIPEKMLPLRISAQGGVGTNEEHQFLLKHYQLDSVGWGTPFLLVPEATTVDENTLLKLVDAKEKDLYLSDISPLGVPFNNLRGNTKDEEKMKRVTSGRPGSSCPKKFLSLNKEFTEKAICTASRQYQHLKLKQLDQEGLSPELYKIKFDSVVSKSCICVGLGTTALLVNGISTKTEGTGVSICPGPNLAYFQKVMRLDEIVDHIYGRTNVIVRDDRPHMFIKELGIYIGYIKKRIDETRFGTTLKEQKYLSEFTENLKSGITYYEDLFTSLPQHFVNEKTEIMGSLDRMRTELETVIPVSDNITPYSVS